MGVLRKMTIQEMREREVLKEYYLFLYELAAKKNYLHASQLTEEEKQYCDNLLSKSKAKLKPNDVYIPLMKNILRTHYGSTFD